MAASADQLQPLWWLKGAHWAGDSKARPQEVGRTDLLAARGCKRESALEALGEAMILAGRADSRVVCMQCAGWLGHRCTLKTIPNMGYLLYRGRRLQRTACHEGVFHRMVKRQARTKAKRTSTYTPVHRDRRADEFRKSPAAGRGHAMRKRKLY